MEDQEVSQRKDYVDYHCSTASISLILRGTDCCLRLVRVRTQRGLLHRKIHVFMTPEIRAAERESEQWLSDKGE